ncbi:dimethylarginine dimethylaminohydrolase family protein [Xanthovirga aplysinae]|uniref:dimethylarginine dimethylaminohydrolase family protein n=1 Tax=Xanthovirga aplysinae TaxID=2529853 RepID=UPI0012BD3BBC|nr:arginine deiminase family protein [Xanthovirga aplysinae]MTI33082.1 amidinotransferase [Xanthovirga aplysinae]
MADIETETLALNVKNETSRLNAVILGIANDFGGTPSLTEAYDPKSKLHIKNGTFPKEKSLILEMEKVTEVFKKYDVKVFRPQNIKNLNQVFARDLGFVIDNKYVQPHILKDREKEQEGVKYVLEQLSPDQLLIAPEDVRIEGGDVMPWDDYIFVGYSKAEDFEKYVVSRTNEAGIQFLKDNFPNRKVKAFELKKSDIDPYENALHLDCCFQPIGKDQAIIYKGGFKNEEDFEFLKNYFGQDKIIEITKEEMYEMNSNVFSISPEVIISDKRFVRLNKELEKRGFQVEAVPYGEVAKMEGLLRCSTLPLIRN